jgi:hypothetical protein
LMTTKRCVLMFRDWQVDMASVPRQDLCDWVYGKGSMRQVNNKQHQSHLKAECMFGSKMRVAESQNDDACLQSAGENMCWSWCITLQMTLKPMAGNKCSHVLPHVITCPFHAVWPMQSSNTDRAAQKQQQTYVKRPAAATLYNLFQKRTLSCLLLYIHTCLLLFLSTRCNKTLKTTWVSTTTSKANNNQYILISVL